MDRLEELIDESNRVKRRAYCPYSKFPVGAAVLGADGRIYTGTETSPSDDHTPGFALLQGATWNAPFTR
jgi:hypothetical protein